MKDTTLELILLSSGDAALFVDGEIVFTAEPGLDEPNDVVTVAKNLATALSVNLVTIASEPPPDDDWTWSDVQETLPSRNGNTAAEQDTRPASDTATIAVPKELWHSVVLALKEAHTDLNDASSVVDKSKDEAYAYQNTLELLAAATQEVDAFEKCGSMKAPADRR